MNSTLKLAAGTAFALLAAPTFATQILYGISGDGASTPESLHTLSQIDASATFNLALGAGDDGEAIAYNSTDGLMDHFSGPTDQKMDAIDLSTHTVTDVPRTGPAMGEVTAATVDAASGDFFVTTLDWQMYRVTSGGAATKIADDMGFTIKGLAFIGSTLYATEHFDEFDFDGELNLLTIDTTDGSVLTSVDVSLAGASLNGHSNGLAYNSATSTLWGIAQGGWPPTHYSRHLGCRNRNR